jgi:hypothetical protein
LGAKLNLDASTYGTFARSAADRRWRGGFSPRRRGWTVAKTISTYDMGGAMAHGKPSDTSAASIGAMLDQIQAGAAATGGQYGDGGSSPSPIPSPRAKKAVMDAMAGDSFQAESHQGRADHFHFASA